MAEEREVVETALLQALDKAGSIDDSRTLGQNEKLLAGAVRSLLAYEMILAEVGRACGLKVVNMHRLCYVNICVWYAYNVFNDQLPVSLITNGTVCISQFGCYGGGEEWYV